MANSGKSSQANLQAALFALGLDRTAAQPLHVQLAAGLRDLVLNGTAAPGMRVPASRQLAQELSVSRATTQAALDQLVAEGYLVGRRGAGTYVAEHLPHLAPARTPSGEGPPPVGPHPTRPFQHSVPDHASFPHAIWAKHLDAAWRRPHPDLLKSPDPFGWGPLRAAIAAHLGAWRGIACGAGQIAITSGARETFDLIARLFPPRGTIQLEDPCFGPMKARLEAAGLRCHLSRVDDEGFDPGQLRADAAGVVVTPSRQFPLGMALPLPRRLALLDWAERQDALVIEDDYDSEFRFTGQPLPALMSLDRGQRTIYVGSFSKLLSPSLRLGYLVVPEGRVAALRAAIGPLGTQASLVPQPALAGFMESGAFSIHLRRMRRLYARRWRVLHDGLGAHLSDWLIPRLEPSGMHIVCAPGPRLSGISTQAVITAADRAGLTVRPLSAYYHTGPAVEGFILGYAAFDEATLEASVRRLAAALTSLGA